MGSGVFLWFGVLLGVVSPTWATPQLITANVGRMNSWVVTAREVMINHMLEGALYRFEKNRVPEPALSLSRISDRLFVRETTSTLIEMAVFLEAESFGALSGDLSGPITAQTRLAKNRLKNHSAWKKLKVSDKELAMFVERKTKAKDFLRFKMEAARIPITDREAEEYFRVHRLKFEAGEYALFKTSIMGYLTQQQMDRRLKDWFDLLQSKYQVRNLLVE